MCKKCHLHLKRKPAEDKPDYLAPPKFAIANGLWIGSWEHSDWPNRGEQVLLALYTRYFEFRVLQRTKANPRKLHCSVSMFRSGNSVANVLLPQIPEGQTAPIQVLFESNGSLTEQEKSFLASQYSVRPAVLERVYNWLKENNVVYKQHIENSPDAQQFIELIKEVKFDSGQIVRFIDLQNKALEQSTPIAKTTEEIVAASSISSPEGKDPVDEKIEVVSQHITTFFPPLEHNTSLVQDSVGLGETFPAVQEQLRDPIQAVKLSSGNQRAYSNEKGVLEGSVFWLYPYGRGGYHQPRQVRLNQQEYYDCVLSLADGTFGMDPTFISIAIDAIRFERMANKVYVLAGREVTTLVTVSPENIAKALCVEMEDTALLQQNRVPACSAQAREVLATIRKCKMNTLGSKESKHAVRQDLFALIAENGLPHLFVTFNPSNPQSILYYNQINRKVYTGEYDRGLNSKIAQAINENVEGQVYAFEEAIHYFIQDAIGWKFNEDPSDGKPNPQGGLFGHVKAFFGVPEATGQSYLHSHWLIWLRDAPRGPSQFRELCDKHGKEIVEQQLVDYAESIGVPGFPARFRVDENTRCQCGGEIKAKGDLGARFRLGKRLANDLPFRAECSTCKAAWTAPEFIQNEVRKTLEKLKKLENGLGTLQDVYRAYVIRNGLNDVKLGASDIPSDLAGLDIEELRKEFEDCLLALFYLDVQNHDYKHRATCLKKGPVCRMRLPKQLSATSFLKEVFTFKTLLFSEFFPVAVAELGRTFHCNTDLQVLMTDNDSGALIVFYIVKYVAKPQDPFARKDVRAIVEDIVKRFEHSREQKREEFYEREGLTEEEVKAQREKGTVDSNVKKLGQKLLFSLLGTLLRGDELDLTMCLHYIKTRAECWTSHKFQRFDYGSVFRKYFVEHETTSSNTAQVRLDRGNIFESRDPKVPPPEKRGVFYVHDDYDLYLGRPEDLWMLSLIEFLSRYKTDRIKRDDEQNILEPYRARTVRKLVAREDEDCVVITVIGPSLPDHFDFAKDVYALLGREAPASNEDENDDEDDEGDEIRMADEHDHVKKDGDHEQKEYEKREAFAFFVLVHYIPHRGNVRELLSGLEQKTFWNALQAHASKISEKDKDRLIAQLEMKASPAARKHRAAVRNESEKESTDDFDSERKRRQQEGQGVATSTFMEQDDADHDHDDGAKQFQLAMELEKAIRRGERNTAEFKEWARNLRGLCRETSKEIALDQCQRTVAEPKDFANLFQNMTNSSTAAETSIQHAKEQLQRFMRVEINPPIATPAGGSTELQYNITTPFEYIALQIGLNTGQMTLGKLLAEKIDYSVNPGATSSFPNFDIKQPIRAIMCGEGGSGKSYVIRAVDQYAKCKGRPDLVLKTSQFGSTASNIGGCTTSTLAGQTPGGSGHSSFHHERNQLLLANATILIVDEYTLSDKWVLWNLHEACVAAKRLDQPFGGMNVVFVGDVFQLGPVMSTHLHIDPKKKGKVISTGNLEEDEDAPMVSEDEVEDAKVAQTEDDVLPLVKEESKQKRQRSTPASQAKNARSSDKELKPGAIKKLLCEKKVTHWYMTLFKTVFVLTVQNRFSGQPLLQSAARAYRAGKWTHAHVDFFNKRIRTANEIDFSKAIVLVATRDERMAFLHSYYRSLEEQGNVVAWAASIRGPDGDSETKQCLKDTRTRIQLAKELADVFWAKKTVNERDVLAYSIYSIGAIVSVTENLAVEANIANGSFGKLRGALFSNDTVIEELQLGGDPTKRVQFAHKPPVAVLVEMFTKGKDIPGLGPYVRPVWRVSSRMTGPHRGVSKTFHLENVPIMPACVSTVHGIQGKTITEEYTVVVTDLRRNWPSLESSAFYVAMTRPKKAEQLAFLRKMFTLNELQQFTPLPNTRKEHLRLWNLAEATWRTFIPDIIMPDRPDCIRYRTHQDEPLGVLNLGQATCWLSVAVQLLRVANARVCGSDDLCEALRRTTGLSASKAYIGENPEEKQALQLLANDFGGPGPRSFLDFLIHHRDRLPEFRSVHRKNSMIRTTDIYLTVPFRDCSKKDFDLQIWLGNCLNSKDAAGKVSLVADSNILFIVFDRNKDVDGSKYSEHVAFRDVLHVDGVQYKLACVVEHEGDSKDDGHFFAWTRPDLTKDQYFKVDDEFVYTPVSFLPAQEPCLDQQTGRRSARMRLDCSHVLGRCAYALLFCRTSRTQ